MSSEAFLLFVVIALVVLALPVWSHSKSWGYAPAGVLMIVLAILLIWTIAEKRPLFRHSLRDDFRTMGHDMKDSFRRATR
jgi:predicted ABC-type exoprotein transport system permease subunit